VSEAKPPTIPEYSAVEFVSRLDQSWQRFMASAIEHGLRMGRRQPSDFMRHFSARDIMEGFRERPELRASLLEKTTGIKWTIAVRKTASSSGVDLEIAVDEGETDAATIVGLLEPDEIVQHLNRERLWHYLTEGEFWALAGDCPEELEIAKAHVAYLLERALAEGLVSHRDIIEGLTADRIAECLPRAALASILLRALEEGHIERGFTEEHLLAVVPPSALVQYVPLAHIWNTVVVPKIARVHGFERGEKVTAAVEMASPAMERAPAVEISPELEDVHVTELVVDDPDDDFSTMVNPLPSSRPAKKAKRARTAKVATEQLGN